MSAKLTRVRSGEGLEKGRTDWARVDRMSPSELERAVQDDPDTFSPDAEWIRKTGTLVAAKPKERLTVRFDTDMVKWFKRQGRGYQTRMNAVLRSYFEHERGRKPRT